MNNFYKIIILFFAIFIIYENLCYAKSNLIDTIDINCNINQNNDIEITEVWKGNFYIGSEVYRFFENFTLNDIENFYVLENGKKFQNVDNWSIENPKEQKYEKSSIIQNEDGVELCFGIGEPGYHEYKIKYILKNLIKNNELNLKFLNTNFFEINNIKINFKGNFDNKVFSKLINLDTNANIKENEIQYELNDINDDIQIYLNFDGIDNSIKKDKVIKIKSNEKNNLFFILKMCISVMIFCCFIIILLLYFLNKKQYIYQFKPF